MKKRSIWMTNLRAVATIAVILLHVSAPILYKYGKVSNTDWHIGNFFDGIVRWCVPIFFMITGALLLNEDYKLKVYLKKRFFRIIPPFIFWSLVYILYDHFTKTNSDTTLFAFLETLLTKLLNGSKFHLWFVYVLLGLYLVIPILRKWIKNASRNEILYFLMIWFCTIIFSIPYLKAYIPNINLDYFAGYIGYLVLGYFLSKIEYNKQLIPFLFIIIGCTITILGTIYITEKNHKFDNLFYSYLSLNVLLSSTGVFLLFKNTEFRHKHFNKLMTVISDHSYGIYLIHILILILLKNIGINWNTIHPLIGIPFTTCICALISLLIIFVLRKVKFGNYISG
ncbi:acyltransferase [Psychroserpens ponticola]|uniref:Acyltransferase family protein n=1 Tax=Psychroserpens ponticola TaxID=2932268 RepID=A0ABY7S042_9FLAO|nr:acyltransferase family protein [Psychroserpens ponticola]WCO02759.1 acyltransferase family protein [Psychroserpens ponticola]